MNSTIGNDLAKLDSTEALKAASEAAKAGREVLLHYLGRIRHIEKKYKAGLVSEADKESEIAIFSKLRKSFPTEEYLGEEGTGAESNFVDITQTSRWVVDPLDGTTNFIHQFPLFGISIGLEVKGQVMLGLIDMPMLNETYVAIRGQGAWVNGKRLQVSQTSDVEESLLATGFFGDHEENLQEQLKIFSQIVRQSRGIRRAGSAAYDLTQVARGVFDAFWEKDLKPWDTAAGMLLVTEAGGTISTYRGGVYNPYKKTLLATNKKLHDSLQNIITPHLDSSSD